jgi:hypothetical protein
MRVTLTKLGDAEGGDLNSVRSLVESDAGYFSGSGMFVKTQALLDESERVQAIRLVVETYIHALDWRCDEAWLKRLRS